MVLIGGYPVNNLSAQDVLDVTLPAIMEFAKQQEISQGYVNVTVSFQQDAGIYAQLQVNAIRSVPNHAG